jgi:hypothetical protein
MISSIGNSCYLLFYSLKIHPPFFSTVLAADLRAIISSNLVIHGDQVMKVSSMMIDQDRVKISIPQYLSIKI